MSETKKLRERSEIDEKFQWKLEDLFATDEAWEESLKKADEYFKKIESYKGKISKNAKDLYDFLKLSDEITDWAEEIANYSSRKNDQDTTVAKYQDYFARTMGMFVKMQQAYSFVEPEIFSVPEETIEGFFKELPELDLYRRYYERMKKSKPHTLSAEMEELMAAASDITSQADNIFGMLDNADIKFDPVKDSKGEEHSLSHGSYGPLMESSDRELRKATYESYYKEYKQYANTFASILATQVKGLIFNARARKYNNTLEASLSRTEVPVAVYKNLIEAVHNNMDKMYKYVQLRKKALKVDELHFYDIYTSIVGDSEKKIPYEEAQATILEALKPLGEEYCKVLKSGFENRWVDVYENKGKRSGAYSAGTKTHPYVLMNYADTLDSMFTLAHEMGHSMHSYLSYKNQPTVYANYVIFVAEIASTCNEALLMQYLLKKTTDKKERAALINKFLEQFKSTLYRQTMFAEFELKINELSERGETMTAETLCNIYGDLQKLYFGEENIVIDENIKYEWARIPHFYYNFYVFQYATGFSAAIALSQKILKEGEPAVKKYLEFLSGGCSKEPLELLKGAGVDLTTAEPINDALKLFGELIDEMDELLK
ncbi:MAG: oligoendopeptidase F [Lachnospiraceae bacterium]|nr:oligoendopeptidase F [Lachnospiraceae bacterium]